MILLELKSYTTGPCLATKNNDKTNSFAQNSENLCQYANKVIYYYSNSLAIPVELFNVKLENYRAIKSLELSVYIV